MSEEVIIKVKVPKEMKEQIEREINIEDLMREYKKLKAQKQLNKFFGVLGGRRIPKRYRELKYERLLR